MDANQRLQSAMEYLMTYGWAILIIAVVIAVLFTLGVFNASNFSSTACIAVSGFICASPAMNTSGYLSVTVGQIVNSSIKITGIDCTGTQGTPTFQGTSINLSAESTTPIVFHCPLASQTLGGYFTGYLWLQYMANGQTLQEQIATVTVSATTSGPLAPPRPRHVFFTYPPTGAQLDR